MSLYLERLTARALEALPRDKTVFFFAVGVLEDHGPHLPIGQDLVEARAATEALSARIERDMPGWTSVLAPSAPLGIDSDTTRIALTTRGYVLRDWLVDQCGALARLGFEHFVCVSGSMGPRQLTAIEEAGKLVKRRFGRGLIRSKLERRAGTQLMSASSALVTLDEALASPAWPDPKEHGAERDTSVALALFPELVDGSYPSQPEALRDDGFLARAWSRFMRRTAGYWGGTPGAGDADKGLKYHQRAIDLMVPKVRAVLEGADGRKVLRSWYSAFPFNGSYFKAWLLTLALGLLAAAWVALSYPV